MLALEDGVAVGFGAVVDTGRALHLADLFVVPENAGRGIGRALLEPRCSAMRRAGRRSPPPTRGPCRYTSGRA